GGVGARARGGRLAARRGARLAVDGADLRGRGPEATLVEALAEARDRERHAGDEEGEERPDLVEDVAEARAAQQDAADDPNEVRQREDLGEELRRPRHA